MWIRSGIASMWSVVILVLCWLPRQFVAAEHPGAKPFLFPNFDKVGHFGLFAIFGFLWMWAASKADRRGRAALRVAIAGLILAAVSELGQEYIPHVNRDAGWMDGLADAIGVLAGIGSYWLLARVSARPAAGSETKPSPTPAG